MLLGCPRKYCWHVYVSASFILSCVAYPLQTCRSGILYLANASMLLSNVRFPHNWKDLWAISTILITLRKELYRPPNDDQCQLHTCHHSRPNLSHYSGHLRGDSAQSDPTLGVVYTTFAEHEAGKEFPQAMNFFSPYTKGLSGEN